MSARGSGPGLARCTVICLLLLTTGLTGCIGGDGTAPTAEPTTTDAPAPMAQRAGVPAIPAELAEIQPLELSMDDGAELRGHVYLPDGQGPFAPVLVLTPYTNVDFRVPDSDDYATEEDGRRTMEGRFQPLMDAGFAVAIVNVRGTGASDGCVQYGGPRGIADAGQVVQALAEAPWSNGKVGMIGASYVAKTQYMAIASGAPALEAVVAVSSVLDHWNFLTKYGAWTGYDPMTRYIGDWSAPSAVDATGPGPMVQPSRAQCPDYSEDYQGIAGAAQTGDDNAWLDARDYRDEIAQTDVAMLVTNGLTDREGHILQFEDIWDIIPHEDKRLIVGQWGHAYPFDGAESFTAQEAVPWLDRYLRDGPPAKNGTVTFQDSTETVHETTAWPPADTQLTRLLLSEDRLVQDPDAVDTSEQRFLTMDRGIPYPTECPGAAAVYATPPLAEDVLVAGNFFLNITLTSTAPDENIAAYLWTGDGLAPCPNDGQAELEQRRYASSDLYHRGHLEHGEPFPIGEPGVIELRSVPMAEVLPAGSRLLLAVGAGHPSLIPTPGETVLTAHTGPDVLGELWLPVADGELVFEGTTEGANVGAIGGSR